MKKIIKISASFGAGVLVSKFLVSILERMRKQKDGKAGSGRRETGRNKNRNGEQEKHQAFGPYEACLKRPLDFTAALAALLFLSPVYLAVALLVRVRLGRPVLFKQERPGKEGKIFWLYKFRTMTDARDEDGELLPDEERLSEFGKWLRSTSLDELPELLNILKGEMSLVGPRPLLVEYLPRYNARQARRHEVRPGLTGLAQVSGRNGLSWEEKFEDDVKYVDHITFMMDMKIILKTAAVVWKREGINSGTAATVEGFMGNGS